MLLNQLINRVEELENAFLNNLKWKGGKWKIST